MSPTETSHYSKYIKSAVSVSNKGTTLNYQLLFDDMGKIRGFDSKKRRQILYDNVTNWYKSLKYGDSDAE